MTKIWLNSLIQEEIKSNKSTKKRYERKDMHRTLSLETWSFAKVIMSSKCRERKTQLTAEKKKPSKQ